MLLSKLNQPGSKGLSAGSAGFCSGSAAWIGPSEKTRAANHSKITNTFFIFSTSSKMDSISSSRLTRLKKLLQNSTTAQRLVTTKTKIRAIHEHQLNDWLYRVTSSAE